jgi:hypothetical protein
MKPVNLTRRVYQKKNPSNQCVQVNSFFKALFPKTFQGKIGRLFLLASSKTWATISKTAHGILG